jgi:hypothetical protein
MKVFDKAKYHSDGDFPKELSEDQAYVVAGMFLAWCADHGLLSDEAASDFEAEVAALRSREGRPADLYRAMDGVLSTEELSPKGQAFADRYFDFDAGEYLDDFLDILAEEYPSGYHVPDTWANYDRLAPRIAERFEKLFP